jgi:serine/threonine-protein kinase
VVQAQVDKILASDLFANAGNLSRFLRFIVDQTLDGQGEHLKEYRIAVEVFGRGDGFDPKEDTIVRVQARNLRAKLANYYESEGRGDPVIIELPKGRYAPSFRSVRPLRKSQSEGRRSMLYFGLVLIVALAAGTYWIERRPARGGIQLSILVWPFSDASPEEGGAYLANGICTDLITALAKTKAVRVVRGPTGLRGDAATALGSGRQYGVQFVLTGNLRAAEGEISLKAVILRTRDGSQIWEQEFARPAAELSSVLEESARAVLRELLIDLPKERPLITSRAANLEAYDLYQRALDENATDRAALLEQAIARDPKYAPAHARLALASNAGTPESLAKKRAAAALALQLDDQLADAHLSQAVLLDHFDLDWTNAEREYLRALDLDPTSVNAYYFFSVLLTRMGRFDEALALLRRGEQADPLNVWLEGLEGWTLGMQRHYDQSIDRLRKLLESDPNDY